MNAGRSFDQSQGSLPPTMFRPLWHCLLMILKSVDQPNSVFSIVHGLRGPTVAAQVVAAFGKLVPCGTCSQHFLKDSMPSFPTHLVVTQRSFFRWGVKVREAISKRVQGKVYTEQECDLTDVKLVWDAM